MLDKDFLKKLDKTPLKETFVEIIALNENDEVLESIEGRVSTGTINIDGTSAVRRTCSLTIVADELNIHEYYWGLHTKFKLSVGLKNDIDFNYPEIIWFKQGTFVISSFTTQQDQSNYIINIQGKDKMTLLNGEMGGMITGLTHDFGKVSVTQDNGDIVEEDMLIKDIIIGAVHQFAGEPLYNIIVNDLEDKGLELLEYKGDTPFYILIKEDTGEMFNSTFDGAAEYIDIATNSKITLENIPEDKYNPLFDLERAGVVLDYMKLKDEANNILSVAKMSYGKTAGYRLTDLTYAGDLILNIGENVTSMLDKIVNMLGEYEYFYDVDGRFIFQKKKTYFNTSWNNIVNNNEENFVEPAAYTSAISYSFDDGELISSYQNNPNYSNIRNDFSVWGVRRSVTGQELPVHMRYAIDVKPNLFVNYEGIHFSSESEAVVKEKINEWYPNNSYFTIKANLDWRELIYQMALDYQKHHLDEDYYIRLAANNYDIYPNGKTGYEQYYVDMEGFWRQLYNPEYNGSFEQVYLSKNTYEGNEDKYFYAKTNYKLCTKDMPYRSTTQYFTWTADENYKYSMISAIGLSKASYEANFDSEQPIDYYIIDSNEIVDTKIIEPYHKDGLGYYDAAGNLKGAISQSEYENNPKEYYQIQSKEYLPCAKIETYKSARGYYDSNDGIIKPQPDEETYYNNPDNYYYRNYEYVQCSTNDSFDENNVYYIKTVNTAKNDLTYAKITAINEELFNKNKTLYYTKNQQYSLIKCVSLLETIYNPVYRYYIYSKENDTYILTEVAENNYEQFAYAGNLYYEKIYLECCERYVSYKPSIKFYKKVEDEYNKDDYWVKDVALNPEGLNFWFDFLDEDSELQKFSCHAIGDRPKGVNDNQVKAIYFRETPTVVFVDSDNWETADRSKLGYTYLQLPSNLDSLFSISAQGKSAKSVVDDYIYKYACSAENITISTLPIYHLEPNTRIFILNKESGINGEYILTKYSFSLGTNSNMSISASKAVDRLY